MGKAFPVFKFAFAAYAASGAAAARELTLAPEQKLRLRARFLQGWKVFSSDRGLMVKIGVRDDATSTVAVSKAEVGPYREIWLSEIREAASAFSGVARRSEPPLRNIRAGQRIGFDPTHILDWKIDCPTQVCEADCAAEDLCDLVSP